VTAFHITSWQTVPGRWAEVFQTVNLAREVHRRHGFGGSAWRTIVSGGDPATLWYLLMSSSIADHFGQMDALTADPEWQELVSSRIDRPDAAATMLSSGLWRTVSDLPDVVLIPSQVAPRAQLISGFAAMNAAQRAAFRTNAPRVVSLVEPYGLNVGFAEAVAAGSRTGEISVVMGAASLVALGQAIDGLAADKEWGAYQAESAADPNRPVLTNRTIRQELI
jgi:hypothetical protein